MKETTMLSHMEAGGFIVLVMESTLIKGRDRYCFSVWFAIFASHSTSSIRV